eukprot:1387529-Amorphochlora_amoeboformis.AAC.1
MFRSPRLDMGEVLQLTMAGSDRDKENTLHHSPRAQQHENPAVALSRSAFATSKKSDNYEKNNEVDLVYHRWMRGRRKRGGLRRGFRANRICGSVYMWILEFWAVLRAHTPIRRRAKAPYKCKGSIDDQTLGSEVHSTMAALRPLDFGVLLACAAGIMLAMQNEGC